jgi:hypothetical protein
MSQDKIGQLITEDEERDAIHVAIAPVTSKEKLLPGQPVGFVKDDEETVGSLASKIIGIVDPFLPQDKMVMPGERFWLFLFPNTITSLKHNWTHPEFRKVSEEYRISKKWITEWASQYGWSFDRAIKAGDNRTFFLGEVCYDEVPKQFWYHYGIVKDGKPLLDEEEHFFRCAC